MRQTTAVLSPAVMLDRVPVARPSRRESLAWALGPLSIAFVLVGGADIALTWYPLRIGNPQWELGTIMQTLNGLPVLSLGLVLLAVWVAASGRRWALLSVAVAMILTAVAVVAMGALLSLSVPLALHAVQDPAILQGLKKATAKAAVQVATFASVFLWLGVRGIRKASKRLENV